MDSFDVLPNGMLLRILKGERHRNAVFQILSFLCIDPDVFRVTLSDGLFSTRFALFSRSLVHRVNVNENSVVKLLNYIVRKMTHENETRNIIAIKDMKVIAQPDKVIGDPKTLDNSDLNQAYLFETPVKNPFKIPLVSAVDLGTEIRRREGWVIRVRVMRKLPVCPVYGGKNKMVTCDLADKSGFIKAVAFGSECDKLDTMQVNKVYWLTSAEVRSNKDLHSKCKFELKFNTTTVIQESPLDSGLPTLEFSFYPLNCIMKLNYPFTTDMIGICESASDVMTVAGNTQRVVRLVSPESGPVQIALILRGEIAEDLDVNSHPVIAVKSCNVTKQQDETLTLSLDKCSAVVLNPELPQTEEYIKWFRRRCKGHTEFEDNFLTQDVKTSDFAEARRQVLLSKEKIVHVISEVEVIEANQQFLVNLCCVQCSEQVHDWSWSRLVCPSCGPVEKAVIQNSSCVLRLGDKTSSDWVYVGDTHCRTLLGVTSGYIEGINTKFHEAMRDLTGRKFHVRLKYNKKVDCNPCELVDISPSTS